jgi:hypothetical protein
MQLRYSNQPIELEPIFQQQVHSEKLTPMQLEEARSMGIKNLTTKNTQYDLLRLVKFQKNPLRHTPNHVKHLVKKQGRKRARLTLRKQFEKRNVLTEIEI